MAEQQIYTLIGEAMRRIGAIKKDRKNQQQGFMFRGIDAVYNALNPVMADLGLFIIPEVMEQTREERQTKNGNALIYSILKVRFTMYAPDGSSVSGVVTGEGMDSGDKASNKAMSIALKYFAFETFMIPTDETAVDPDAEVHEVAQKTPKAAQMPAKRTETAQKPAACATVEKVQAVPQTKPETPAKPATVLDYFAQERESLRVARGITAAENNELWTKQIEVLRENGLISETPLSKYSMEDASALVNYMYTLFDPHGTELKAVEG